MDDGKQTPMGVSGVYCRCVIYTIQIKNRFPKIKTQFYGERITNVCNPPFSRSSMRPLPSVGIVYGNGIGSKRGVQFGDDEIELVVIW